MGRASELLQQILRGTSDANISFESLTQLLKHLGFEERVRGSHHIYRKEGIEEKLNLQKFGAKAKPYQVRQVRSVLQRYRLTGEE